MQLHFGVIDLPYTHPNGPAKAPPPSVSPRLVKRKGKTVYVWTKVGWVTGTLTKKNGATTNDPTGAKPPKSSAGMVTTGQVAEWLEAKYHIMEVFYELEKSKIFKHLQESLEGKLEDIMMGAPVDGSPFLEGTSEIVSDFKKFLSQRRMEDLGIPGVPTQAALQGVNHRLKLKRGPRRPSFIDTGLYQSSAAVWVE